LRELILREARMLAHLCINPLDPYAEQEVLVEYEVASEEMILRSVWDESGYDVLPDLEHDHIKTLEGEIIAYHRLCDGRNEGAETTTRRASAVAA
jgi:hypothetical protein